MGIITYFQIYSGLFYYFYFISAGLGDVALGPKSNDRDYLQSLIANHSLAQ